MTLSRHTRRAAGAALALLLAGPVPAMAISRPMSVTELSGEAELIVQGRIARVESRWNGDRSAIYSDVAVAVGRTLKGTVPASSKGREVVFRVLGGEVDGVSMISAHEPLPAVGEEMVLFLRPEASTASSARSSRPAAAGGGGPLELVGQESGAYAVRSGRVRMHGREVVVDELLAAVARAAK